MNETEWILNFLNIAISQFIIYKTGSDYKKKNCGSH
jgi:hypothetical protein